MNKQFSPLNSGEVLSVNKSAQFIIGHGTFRVQEFMNALREQVIQHGFGSVSNDKAQWFSEEGIECEVLQFGSNGWQKGTVRLYLEFSPDEQGVQSKINSNNTKASETIPETSINDNTFGDEEIIAETEATATAIAASEVAQEEEDLGFGDDFSNDEELNFDDGEEDLGFQSSLDEESITEDTPTVFESPSNEEISNDAAFGDDNLDFGDDLDFGSDTDGEDLDIGDVFATDDDALEFGGDNDDEIDDVWGEMEDL